jgi:hypothetical protein
MDVRGEEVSMWVSMVSGMGWVFGHGDQERGVQWLGLMMGGVMELQGSRDGQGWAWSKKKISMGSNLVGAHKVFVNMAEREKFSKF